MQLGDDSMLAILSGRCVCLRSECMYACDYVCDYVGIPCPIIVYVSPAVCMFQVQRTIALNEWNGLIKSNN